MATIIYANYNYCCTFSFSCPQRHEMDIMISLIQVYFLLLKYLFYAKKYEAEDGRGLRTVNSGIP